MSAAASKSSAPLLERVSAIDALRGMAALAVLLYHARGVFWVGIAETYRQHAWQPDLSAWLGYLSAPLGLGGQGVTLFFVLSGYCIHRRGARLLATNPDLQLDWKTFAGRRFWRIYPTYLAALLVTALIDQWLAGKTGTLPPGQDNSPYALLMSCLTLQGYFAPHFGSNGVFWTLAMEVHLYAAYPLLFLLSRRWGPQMTLGLTLLAGLGYVAADQLIGIEKHLPHRFQSGPVLLPYWFTWTLGFYWAEVEAGRAADFGDRIWRWLATGCGVAGLTFSLAHWQYPAEVCWALFFTSLLRWSLRLRGQQFWNQHLGRGLAVVGVFSYSLYAIHAPLLLAIHAMLDPMSQKYPTIWPTLGVSVGVLPIAWLFFRLVEWWSVRKVGSLTH